LSTDTSWRSASVAVVGPKQRQSSACLHNPITMPLLTAELHMAEMDRAWAVKREKMVDVVAELRHRRILEVGCLRVADEMVGICSCHHEEYSLYTVACT
jgi:hypothetical protein